MFLRKQFSFEKCYIYKFKLKIRHRQILAASATNKLLVHAVGVPLEGHWWTTGAERSEAQRSVGSPLMHQVVRAECTNYIISKSPRESRIKARFGYNIPKMKSASVGSTDYLLQMYNSCKNFKKTLIKQFSVNTFLTKLLAAIWRPLR